MPPPSVLLHDHLDGGLRPGTIVEIAEAVGYTGLPATDPEKLAAWFDQSGSGSLERYLESFIHTIAVMQDAASLERVGFEAAEDLAADGVVYAEIRFCPSLNTDKGLTTRQVVEAVSTGIRDSADATGLEWGLIVCALRDRDDSGELARLAASSSDLGIVGFDLAGPEAGYPPDRHLAAFRVARFEGVRLTIHAGEHAGEGALASIRSAVDLCGAERIGHGIELVADCRIEEGEIVETGPLASAIRNRRIPLEVCPSSNLATSGLTPEDHPLGAFHRAGFNVTINTDNRLMSTTTMSAELEFAVKYHGFDIDDLARVSWRSLDAAFCPWEVKARLWEDVLAPGYRALGADIETGWR